MSEPTPSLISLPVLRELMDVMSWQADRARVIQALLESPAHWEVVAQAHDAGVITPLTVPQLKQVAAAAPPHSATWAQGAQARAAGAGSLVRLQTLVRLLVREEHSALAEHLANGRLSPEMHLADQFGRAVNRFGDFSCVKGRPTRVSEVALALTYTYPVADQVTDNIIASIDDVSAPLVEFEMGKRPFSCSAADLAACNRSIAHRLLNRRGAPSEVTDALRAAVEARIADMVKASKRTPRSAKEMHSLAEVLTVLANRGILPSKGVMHTEITVETLKPSRRRYSTAEPSESKTLPLVDAFPYPKAWDFHCVEIDGGAGVDPGPLWTHFADSGDAKALQAAVDAGFDIDRPGARLRPINAAIASSPLQADVLQVLVDCGADAEPVIYAANLPDNKAALSAARAMKALRSPANVQAALAL